MRRNAIQSVRFVNIRVNLLEAFQELGSVFGLSLLLLQLLGVLLEMKQRSCILVAIDGPLRDQFCGDGIDDALDVCYSFFLSTRETTSCSLCLNPSGPVV